jgi:hypothetical protein
MKPLKTRSKPILKKIVVTWYGEITFEILQKKTHEIHKNKILFKYFNYVPIEHKKFDSLFFYNSKELLKARSNSDPSKVHNYYLIKISQENIFTLTFMISLFNQCLVVINNLKWNSI